MFSTIVAVPPLRCCTLPADSGEDAANKDKDCAAINAIFRGLSVH